MSRMKELIFRDKTSSGDCERLALFSILSGNDDLYSKVSFVYDFAEHCIKPDCLDDGSVDLCSSSRSLLRLGFNLFNGFPADVRETFYSLDSDNIRLALEAIQIRFS